MQIQQWLAILDASLLPPAVGFKIMYLAACQSI